MKIGIGIIGCGAVSKLHIDSFKEIDEIEIKAVSDIIPDNAFETGRMLGVDFYHNYRELLGRADISIVSICTPSGLHEQIAVDAAKAKKHIIVEKPLEITVDKIDHMIHTCQENGVKMACIFNNRYREGNIFTKKAIEGGRFGRLINVNACIRWYRKQEYYSNSKWRGTWILDGGGALMNQSIHYIDLLLWFAGGVRSVYGYTGTLLHRAIETEDTAVAVLKFKSGALGTIISGTSMFPGFPARIEITGERGSADIRDNGVNTWEFADKDDLDEEALLYMDKKLDNKRASDPMAFDCKYHKAQLENIIHSFKINKDADIDGLEARKSVELICAIYKSAQTGKEIWIE